MSVRRLSTALLLLLPAPLLAQAAPPPRPAGWHGAAPPASFFAGNRARLMEKIKAMGPGTLAVIKSMPLQSRSGDGLHAYRQDSDFYYFTGLQEAETVALLDADASKPYTLLVRASDPRRERYDGARVGVEGAVKRFGADQAERFPEAEKTLREAVRKARRVVLISNFDEEFRRKVLDWVYPPGADNNHATFRKILVDGRNLAAEMRLFKQPEEVAMLQAAMDASLEGHLAAMRATSGAANEGQVAGAFEGTVRGLGARFLGYGSIVGAGNQACTLHYLENDQPIAPGSLVLMDAAAEIGGYTADITRTWPASGKFSGEQRAVYDLVLKAQEAAIALCRPGRAHKEGYAAAMRILSDGLVDLGILKGDKDELFAKGAHAAYTMHGISHWLGLDVHDTGDYGMKPGQKGGERILEAGMVLTVEPGIYIPKGMEGVDPKWQGIGVRLEDDILVTADGPKNLSARLPRQAEEIERIVQSGKGRR
jgi:Xaa-Pro aminopeptidase